VDTIEAARDAVVVGVDDTSLSRSAVLWAAEEARLRHVHLLIVHVGKEVSDEPDRDGALARELLLNGSAEAASRREPTVIVGTWLLSGAVGERLVEVSRTAAMLVLGTDLGGALSSRSLDGIAHRLASSGLCDVVAVRRMPKIGDTGLSQILALWTSEAARAGVLSAAAEEAILREAGLTLALPGSGPRGSVSESEVADEDSVARDLAHLASRYPGLQVTVDQIDPTSVAAVGNALNGCHLAVLRYRHNGSTRSIAADLADDFVRQATCPLLFPVDHVDRSSVPHDSAERGAVARRGSTLETLVPIEPKNGPVRRDGEINQARTEPSSSLHQSRNRRPTPAT
jgi:nucleotide-binding universal stress UspA family protein